jgi:hypothetical protein
MNAHAKAIALKLMTSGMLPMVMLPKTVPQTTPKTSHQQTDGQKASLN